MCLSWDLPFEPGCQGGRKSDAAPYWLTFYSPKVPENGHFNQIHPFNHHIYIDIIRDTRQAD